MTDGATNDTSRRAVLEKGALLGSALAMGAIGGAAGDTGDGATSASVGTVQGAVYQWSSGPDGNGYAGPNSGRSNVSPNTGDVYIGWDTGAEKLFRGDGSSWVELADFSAIGTGGGGGGSGYPTFAAVVADDGTSVDVTDFGGSSSTTSYANVSAALNQLALDYDGNLAGNDPLGANIYIRRGEYSPNATSDLTRGVNFVGPRYFYNRSPSSAGGREYFALFDTSNSPDPMFRMEDSQVPNDAAGSGLYGLDMVGDGPQTGSTTFVRMGEAGRTVVEKCDLADTGGDGIYAIDSFSAHVIDTQIRDCGSYSEDGSGNENGTNGIRAEIATQNVNLTIGGTFVIQGPGAGVASPSTDIPSAIRTGSGASCKMIESGGRRSGVKVHSGAATAAGIKGEDLILRNIIITGEGTGAAAVWMTGGRLVAQGGEWEKMRDILYMENNFTGGVSKVEGVYFDSANADGGGEGNGIRVPSGGSGGVPTVGDCTFINMDRSCIRIEDGGGSARIVGGEAATIGTGGTGYIIEDNRASPSERHQILGFDDDGSANGVINDWGLMGTYLATQSNSTGPHTMLGEQQYSNAVVGDLEPGELAFDDNRGGTGNYALLKKDSAGTVHYWDAGGTL